MDRWARNLEHASAVAYVSRMDVKTPITLGVSGAITAASVGHSYGLRLFSPPSTLPLAMTALSTGSVAQVTGLVTYNAIDGKRIEILPPANLKVEQT
jgi:hypothetical protein